MKTIDAGWMGTLALGLVAVALAGCGGGDEPNAASAGDDGSNEVNAGETLTAATDAADFGNVIGLEGRVGMFEGSTTIALFNRSQPAKAGILHDINGGQMGISAFDTSVVLGDITQPDGLLAGPGDCISVANVGTGGRATGPTLAEAKGKKEFGAFAYAHIDGRGDAHPAWLPNGPKVYATVEECLKDPIRK